VIVREALAIVDGFLVFLAGTVVWWAFRQKPAAMAPVFFCLDLIFVSPIRCLGAVIRIAPDCVPESAKEKLIYLNENPQVVIGGTVTCFVVGLIAWIAIRLLLWLGQGPAVVMADLSGRPRPLPPGSAPIVRPERIDFYDWTQYMRAGVWVRVRINGIGAHYWSDGFVVVRDSYRPSVQNVIQPGKNFFYQNMSSFDYDLTAQNGIAHFKFIVGY
jgi:hypothetical protein